MGKMISYGNRIFELPYISWKTILTIAGLLTTNALKAQVTGADLFYKYQTTGKYEVVLKVFYSCSDKVPSQVQPVTVFETMGHKAIPPYQLLLDTVAKIITPLSTVCSQQADCIIEAIYKAEIDLMPLIGGYNLNWSTCCVEGNLMNIQSMNKPGFNLVAYIPGPETAEKNSMPTFGATPVFSFCKDKENILNYAAIDIDGDSIVYTLEAPYALPDNSVSRKITGPNDLQIPFLPDPPPYSNITFIEGYSPTEPVGKKAIILDSHKGTLHFKPANTGSYLLGYTVKEYRNTKLLSSHQRVSIITVTP